ncbi:bifunctional hydroxymethylpyrimidine kinase/phosphomethylpyrimidine kinase [Bartonella tamiae]|uniref:hydroxymethylpyrimidine kinase n=1 Tax=Bartonella tamiae Th239 TaxID=1094558 RepID=J0R757_9HYPH|nr:bifunctional hydroxymethylpyrimidine kinase/phosphomethylpyrimidine kinase [Bartonella tamiae]EJF91564.1 phosphomethylpyrimidine kinase [Bartonella tamiae Th239]EJF92452.1 phosphomethylpyrimidine kinase [Bartonella tamiae Th307]
MTIQVESLTKTDIRKNDNDQTRTVIPNILTIAGTDPSGGAGMQADIKTFSAMKTYAMSVVTAVVAQNTTGVRAFEALDASFVSDQIDAVFEDVAVDAVKIGMIANIKIAQKIAERLIYHQAKNIVLDPVMVAKSGDLLLEEDAIVFIREILVPMAAIITPNLPEASVLLNIKPQWSFDEMRQQVPKLLELQCRSVLLKGGHLKTRTSPDIFGDKHGLIELEAERVITQNDHGTGCTLSAAIAALLPTTPLVDSVRLAKNYITDALKASHELHVGHGHGPVHHFYHLWKNGQIF